jgi:hypothetical protein
MKHLLKILGIASAFFIFSCRENNSFIDDKTVEEYRTDLSLKPESEQKKILSGLTTKNRIKLWQNKIDQIESQGVSDEQKTLLHQIKNEVNNLVHKNYDGVKLFELALEMAKLTPEEEFMRMFSEVGDYKKNASNYKRKFSNKFLLSDLNNELNRLKNQKNAFNSKNNARGNGGSAGEDDARRKCDCRWSCGFYGPGTNDDCEETDFGCGFFGLQPCTRYAGPA